MNKTNVLIVIALTCVAMATTAWLLISGHTAWAIPAGVASLSGLLVLSLLWIRVWNALKRISGDSPNVLTGVEEKINTLEKSFSTVSDALTNISNTDYALPEFTLRQSDSFIEAYHELRKKLQVNALEEQQRAWRANGLAAFSELFKKKGELSVYTSQMLSTLVKYVQANQGMFFIRKEDQSEGEYLELVSTYAWDKQRFSHEDRRIFPFQGQLGQAMLEKELVFLTDVPSSYCSITSGLGKATPRNLIILPLVHQEVLYGMIELALFEPAASHEVDFLKTIGTSIAAELASMNTMASTQQLLDESQKIAQELKTQEEELKQNLEELSATQEEMARKQAELASVFEALDMTMATAEFSIDGMLLKYNSFFEQIFQYDAGGLQKKGKALLFRDDQQWERVLDGRLSSTDLQSYSSKGDELWLNVTFTCVRSASGSLSKVLCLIQDITEKKHKEEEFQKLSLVADNTDNSVIITDTDGRITYVNKGFTRITGYEAHEIMGRKPGHFLQGELTDKSVVARLREKIKAQVSIYEEILNYRKDGTYYWVSLAINPVFDENNQLVQFIAVQADITDTKLSAIDHNQKLIALGKANAMAEFDLTGRIIEVNDKFLKMYGYERHELINNSINVFWDKDVNFASELFGRIKDGEIVEHEGVRMLKNGGELWAKTINYPVIDFTGKPYKVLKVAFDVTRERKLADESRRRQAELDSYLEAINNTIASAEFSMEGEFLSGNPIFMTITGRRQEESAGISFSEMMPKEPWVDMMWENLKNGKSFSGEFKVLDNKRKELWMNGTFNPIKNVDGEVQKVAMLAQFITEEKERLADYSSFVNGVKASVPYVELNGNWECRSGNEKFFKLTGLNRMGIRGKLFEAFVRESFHPVLNELRKNAKEAEHQNVHIPFIFNNETHWYDCSVIVSKSVSGEVTKIAFILLKEIPENQPLMAVV